MKAFSVVLFSGGVGCLLGALYAVVYSRPAVACNARQPCDLPAADHPYQGLALALAIIGVMALGFAAIVNRHRF